MDRGWTTICALASSAALDFYLNFKPVGTCLESKTVRTFRCPCVGNRSFVDLYNDSIKGQGLPDWSKLETVPSEPMLRLKTICDLHGPCSTACNILLLQQLLTRTPKFFLPFKSLIIPWDDLGRLCSFRLVVGWPGCALGRDKLLV